MVPFELVVSCELAVTGRVPSASSMADMKTRARAPPATSPGGAPSSPEPSPQPFSLQRDQRRIDG